ncbi:class I SAM-dependent methyltransferase [Algoriphagus sp. H41]|uniref:Class I SAM-dependent methyltransferase n=1 Tax=Algoriphagus oliviformis TaxID=2811231 RepID=A0ABS3C615_9BACT|nr:class I SAM-dependent methyltransferase [Algoriphagus oliviformis]MBN7812006.1 class I SAM-dependent methyltransferase [Algoriphagus oliviformis]
MASKFARLSDLLWAHFEKGGTVSVRIPFSLISPEGEERVFGVGYPRFSLRLNGQDAISALSTLDQKQIVKAYLKGQIDVSGDFLQVLSLRTYFGDRRGVNFVWRLVRPLLFGQVKSDKKWISQHYDLDSDFFRLFLDQRHRAYSQAVFDSDQESLEDAETRKFEFVLESIGAQPGQRILEIGAGWGSFVEFAGQRGIHVTSLTISEQSRHFVQEVINAQNLPCEVLMRHFLQYDPGAKFDAIVNCGVTEHLPDYKASLRQYGKLLKPGGHLYLDASADRTRNSHGTFMNKYVFEGNGHLMVLHEYLAQVAKTPFLIKGIWDDRHNYYLTCREWAKRLDANRELIEERWSQSLYRTFQLYLWGSAEGFLSGSIQAYRVVLQLPE